MSGNLDLLAVAAYLTDAGWARTSEQTTGSVWRRRRDGSGAAVFLPDDPTYGDFALRMGELLTTLAFLEDRSQLTVLVDLCGGGTEFRCQWHQKSPDRREEGR